MTRRNSAVILTALVALAAFASATFLYQRHERQQAAEQAAAKLDVMVRAHSPVIGPADAAVTIVEFFDPACETCRAFYPIVKSLMAKYPEEVRLVIRYAPFHQGSDQVVKLLEAAKRQGKYQPVLEAVLQAQPTWADHGRPNPDLTFEIAKTAGLDIERAREDMARPEMQALLAQDVADLSALQVSRTPTFFVNGRSLLSFGPDQLAALVAEEVAKAKR